MKRLHYLFIFVVPLIAFAAFRLPVSQAAQESQASEPVTTVSVVHLLSDDSIVREAESTLTRMEHGVYGTFKTTGLQPGYTYTVWWIIFNRPGNCTDRECGPDDVYLTDDQGNFLLDNQGEQRPNRMGRIQTGFSSLRATGGTPDEDGSAEFRMHLAVGDTTEAVEGSGLLDAVAAEIHYFLRSHGPAIPGRVYEQLNSAWGGCPDTFPRDPCGDIQFSMHPAPR